VDADVDVDVDVVAHDANPTTAFCGTTASLTPSPLSSSLPAQPPWLLA